MSTTQPEKTAPRISMTSKGDLRAVMTMGFENIKARGEIHANAGIGVFSHGVDANTPWASMGGHIHI